MMKTPTVITGTVGEDSHSIGSRLLSRVLRDAGFNVVELGGLTPSQEFINAARETDASAILMSSLYGMAEIDLAGFKAACVEAGLQDVLLYLGGYLMVGRHDWSEAEHRFKELGFDRVYPPDVDLDSALAGSAQRFARERQDVAPGEKEARLEGEKGRNPGRAHHRGSARGMEVFMLRELAERARSYRRFDEGKPISPQMLTSLVELARLSPSASNKQPLKYILLHAPERNSVVFPCLAFARHLQDWPGPAVGERPTAYIVILGDNEISEPVEWDHAIAAGAIALGAAEAGVGACIIASINRGRLREALDIPSRYQILLVVALGYPAETVVLEEMKGEEWKYWRDENGVHHVPKRRLKDLVLDL